MKFDSNTTIKDSSFSHPTLKLAFSELKRMLDISTGTKCKANGDISITFSVEQCDGYFVRVDGCNLIFSAPSETEILYAVYTFAEELLGFCFIEPGSEIFEPQKKLRLDEGIVITPRKPAIKTRGLIQEFKFDERTPLLADWMAKNRLNYLLVWMKYYDHLSDDAKESFRIRGIDIECGHHNFEYFIPAEKYYNNHPEYFAIINRKRIKPDITDEGFLSGGQLCTSDPGLRKELLKNIIAYCKKNPEVKTISLIPNDGFGWCECSGCRQIAGKMQKGDTFSLSSHVYKSEELYHDLIDNITSELKKVLPEITITFAAYINYLQPAKRFELKDKNAVHFALYWRCINHLINDPKCSINSNYIKTLQQWQAIKNGGKINIYEYYMGVNLYISLPMIHHERVFEETRFYAENDIDGLLTQFQFDNWAAYGINYYLMAKAAYNEDKRAIDVLYSKILPQAPHKIKEFYDYAKQLVDSAGPCHIPYPRALLKRTQAEQYQKLHSIALEISKICQSDFCRRLPLWTDYLRKFKQIFDDYTNGKPDIAKDIESFIDWIIENSDSNIFVANNVRILMQKWLEKIQTNSPWYHYGLDWEDEYIKAHDTSLNKVTED